MKISEEQREYILTGLSNALQHIHQIQENGPEGCIPEIEKLCQELFPIVDAINAVLEQQTE